MRMILEKWYLSLFVIPIILTYFTSYFELPFVLKNWEYSIITSLVIFSAILIYEIIILKKRIKSLEETPKKTDKKIIKELLKILDIDKFHEEIVEQDSWYGYHRESIHRILVFREKARLIGYKTFDSKINVLINNFLSTLDNFIQFSSKRVYGSGEWLIPLKDNPTIHPHEKIKKETYEMNKLTHKSFIELEKLLEYLKKKNYV